MRLGFRTRLRILVTLGCALANFAGRRLPAETMRTFWHHGILTGLLSEKIAREVQPEAAEKAYLGGLLHDIGRLPLLIVAEEQRQKARTVPGRAARLSRTGKLVFWRESHCEVGPLDRAFWQLLALDDRRHTAPPRSFPDSGRCKPGRHCRGGRSVLPGSPPNQSLPRKSRGDTCSPRDFGELVLHMRPPRLLEDDRAVQSHFLENSNAYSPFPRFGTC